jgi:hypothetical protein
MIKAQLLKDSQVHWGGKNFFILFYLWEIEKQAKNHYNGVDPIFVRQVSSKIGNIYANYGSEPQSKLLLLVISCLACAGFFIQEKNTVFTGVGALADWGWQLADDLRKRNLGLPNIFSRG